MGMVRLKITGAVPIHGRKPGDEFETPTDPDGVIIDMHWRRRVADEERFSPGVVAIIGNQSAPPAQPPPAPTKGGK